MIGYVLGLLVASYFVVMGFFQTGYPWLDYDPIVSFVAAGLISLSIIIHIIYSQVFQNDC